MNADDIVKMELTAANVQVILNALYRCPYGDVATTISTLNAFIQRHKMEQEDKGKPKSKPKGD